MYTVIYNNIDKMYKVVEKSNEAGTAFASAKTAEAAIHHANITFGIVDIDNPY